jgi:hypothetical protein
LKKIKGSFFVLSFLGLMLSSLTLFFGAPFLRVLWSRFGSLSYWLAGLAFSPVFIFMGGSWAGAVWILVGLFSEFESRGIRWIWGGLVSLFVSSGVLAGGAYYWLASQKLNTLTLIAEEIHKLLKASQFWQLPTVEQMVNLLQVLPGLVVAGLVITLAHALIFEKVVYQFLTAPRERFAGQVRLLEFKLPDVFVWIAMLSFLGSFLTWAGKPVAENIFIVCVALFLLQGVAILECFFNAVRAHWFVRALGYFLFVFQLFVALAFIGFIDFWMDFRDRFRKMKSKTQTTGM